MPIPPLTILCAKVQSLAYDPAFLESGVTDLIRFGLHKSHTIFANDPRVGKVRHGHISCNNIGGAPIPDNRYLWTFDGTLVPKGSFVEWLDDFEAFLTASPWNPGDLVHRGMLRFFNTMTVVDDATGIELPILDFIAANPGLAKGAIYTGHSLGTFTATCAFLEGSGGALILFAPPKPGDKNFRQTVLRALMDAEGTLESYANPNDMVPRLPLTIDFPWHFEDFQPIVKPTKLQPNLVTPPIPADWESSHHMPNYLRLLEAAANT